mmetsp:Transcript_15906/g.20899  ORF Transcript_15906/g.20899 Transcript_15906/m.20899 type:complete len:1105 (+) Transcript_15906:153-3467(+)
MRRQSLFLVYIFLLTLTAAAAMLHSWRRIAPVLVRSNAQGGPIWFKSRGISSKSGSKFDIGTSDPAGCGSRLGSKGSGSSYNLKSNNAAVGGATPRAMGDISINACAATHPRFELLEDVIISEYGIRQFHYRHSPTGAEVISVVAPDTNKVFGITFRTPPADSTGIPHILEHSVLCGSKQFPSKEPFVELLKGSLNTFLNAFTYPDRTCYPVASQNTKDFYNLVNVYLDAVLFPRAVNDSRVLEQEGWHYELENMDDDLSIKGVVYNEMKGVYSSPDSIRSRATQRALFQTNQYHVDSGGDPIVIPELTFDRFRQFHKDYYHPSNSRVFFYGDDDPQTRLEVLDQYLGQFDSSSPSIDSSIAFQKKGDKPWKQVEYFPVSEDAPKKHMLTVNWLLNDRPLSMKEELALDVLDHLLLGTASSVLHKKLIESGLGESVCGGGLSGELLQSTFSVGLKGIKPEKVDEVEHLILETLNEIADQGFSNEAVAASINTIEFHLREFNTGSFPRGLSIMLGMLRRWIYDGKPSHGIQFEESLNMLKEELTEGTLSFSDLIREYLLQNNHRLTLEMKPSTTMEKDDAELEKTKLKRIKESMSKEELNDIVERTQQLKQFQEQEDDPEVLAKIPRVGLDDIERSVKVIPLEVWENMSDSVKVVTHDLQTNGILYADVAFNMHALSLEEYPYLSVFRRLVMESGTSTMDDVALSRRIGTVTGGIRANSMNMQKHKDTVSNSVENVLSLFMFRGKAVRNNTSDLFDLIHSVATDANLDNQAKTLEILREQKIQYENAVVSSGHSFVNTRIASRHSLLGYLSEITGGITYLQQLGLMINEAESDWPGFLHKLEIMRKKICCRENLVINLTADQKTLNNLRETVNHFIQRIPKAERHSCAKSLRFSWDNSSLLPMENEGLIVPTQVNYVGKGGLMYSEGERIPGSSVVISKFLGTGYLWNNVRVIGGAYGGFASFGPSSGRMHFLSYRDPNLVDTLSTYDRAHEHLDTLEISDDMIQKAIIGAIGDMDSPKMPDQEGFESFQHYLRGESVASRQAWRDEVINTTAADFKAFAQRLAKLQGNVCVVGSKASLEAANEELSEKLKLVHVVKPDGVKSRL